MINFKKNFKLVTLNPLNDYFFNLNKWPLDKAPKVSNCSYLVGIFFILLFHLYAMPSFENFFFINLNFFSINSHLCLIILVFVLFLKDRSRIFVISFLLFTVLVLVYYYFPNSLIGSAYYRYGYYVKSQYLVISIDFFIFLLFFLGWSTKVTKKYNIESFTKGESLFYKPLAPTLYFFEACAFIYCVVWRYVNSTMVSYSTAMQLNYYKYQYLSSVLITKLIFYILIFVLLSILINLFKSGSSVVALGFYALIIVVMSIFLFKEFKEFWTFLHLAAPSNVIKFTYFKFFSYILFFNFLHAFLVIFFNFIIIIVFFSKNSSYTDYYELIYLNIKNFYLIMWLTIILLVSVYLINELSIVLLDRLV